MFARDFAESVRLADIQKAQNAATRKRMQADPGLCAVLLADAKRRGLSEIDWPEYFRNSRV